MAAGEQRGALSLSEPDAGSDTRNIACKAQRDGDEYVLDGTKAWVTNGERAGIVALAARTDEGISAFIVEKEPGPSFEGISVGAHVGKLGYRGVETVEMHYVGHRIPAANLIGEAGRGLPQILGVLEVGRINIASRAVGVAPGGLRRRLRVRAAATHLRQADRRAPGHPAQAGRHGHPARGGPAAHRRARPSARRPGCAATSRPGMAKLFASETALELAMEAMRIHGGVGFTTELPVERYYRDAPARWSSARAPTRSSAS